jgi:hypothetical protein
MNLYEFLDFFAPEQKPTAQLRIREFRPSAAGGVVPHPLL